MLYKVEPIQNASSFKRNPGQKFFKHMYQEAQPHVQTEKSHQNKSVLLLLTAKEKKSQGTY